MNNNLKYNGTTEMDSNNPMIHTFSVEDGQLTGKYEVEFTIIELRSMGIICKTVVEIAGA